MKLATKKKKQLAYEKKYKIFLHINKKRSNERMFKIRKKYFTEEKNIKQIHEIQLPY